MKISIISVFALSCIVMLSGFPAFAGDAEVSAQIESMHGNSASFKDAFDHLQQAMANDDAEAVAEMADFPLSINADNQTNEVQSGAELIENFETLINSETRATVTDQAYGDLFVNADGVMFGDGALWMHNVCEDDACQQTHWAIMSINQ